MTREEKQLLLKDLCARLPYGVKIGLIGAHKNLIGEPFVLDIEDYKNSNPLIIINSNWLPYLRPMSSMTDDERDEFRTLGGVMSHNVQNDTWAICAFSPEAYDWLDEHHFDYRGLIPMGLALEAPDGMYKFEKNVSK